jgi:hypothetical protein
MRPIAFYALFRLVAAPRGARYNHSKKLHDRGHRGEGKSFMLVPIILIVLGALAAANLIIAKQPNAKVVLDKVAPYQGFIGVGAFSWGLWQLILLLIHINLISLAPMHYLVALAMVLVTLGLGFLMGYELLQQYVLSKNAEAAVQGAAVRAKLMQFQIPLGLAGIVVGVVGLIMFLR